MVWTQLFTELPGKKITNTEFSVVMSVSMIREKETPDLQRRKQREGNILRELGKTRKNYNIAFHVLKEMERG